MNVKELEEEVKVIKHIIDGQKNSFINLANAIQELKINKKKDKEVVP